METQQLAGTRAVKLRCAFSTNPRVLPLADGTIRVRGCELEFAFDSPPNWFERHLRESAFDVFEFSLAHYLITRDRPRPQWDWIGLPVFLSKALAALNCFVNIHSGIQGVEDLPGKRFGIPDFTMTAGLWLRAMLREVHGIQAEDLEWFIGRSRTHSQGVLLGIDEKALPNIPLRWLYEAGALDRLLRAGEIDVAYATDEDPIDARDPVLRPLLPDAGRALVGDFFTRRGFVPANHTVLVQRRLVEEHPWLPEALFEAFEASKQEAYRRDPSARCIFPVKDAQDAAEQRERFGEDPFASGVAPNREMLVMAAQQSEMEGTIGQVPRVDELFHPSVRTT
jgi:4,5-dihydroxyphthalate decarboxylase